MDGDEAGDVALIGFDDVFGGVAMVASFVEKIAEGAVGLGGVLAVLDGSADQGGGVYGGWAWAGGARVSRATRRSARVGACVPFALLTISRR